MTSVRPSPGFTAANSALAALSIAVAATALWPIYQTPLLVTMLLGVLIGGTAIAILGAVFRWSAPVVVAATVLAFVALGVPLAVPAEAQYGVLPTADGLLDLVAGVALGWKQLLTISLPVGSYQGLLVPFFTLALVVTVLSVSVALRSSRGGFAVLGPVVLFVAAIAFGPDAAWYPVPLALALFAVSLAWIAYRRWHRRRAAITGLVAGPAAPGAEPTVAAGIGRAARRDGRRLGIRSLIGAGIVVALAAGTATVAATLLPPVGERDVLRTSVVQPFDARDYASPLSGFRRYWQAPAVDDVLLTVAGLPEGARLRVATLDTYNGVIYSVGSNEVDAASGSFSRVPYEIDQRSVSGDRITVTVRVDGYAGPWLPTVGAFERISFGGTDASSLRNSFYYNDTTGTAAVINGLGAGDEYTLEAVIPAEPAPAELATLAPGSAVVPAVGLIPDELALTLETYVAGITEPGERLVAMLDGLRSDGYVSHGVSADEPTSRSGHSADRITQLLTDQRMIGDAEQYAVTAALMARELGFPARVVLGFAPESASTDIRGRDVSAWIEVNTEQFGWVTVDPNPAVRDIPPEVPQEPTSIARPQSIVPPVAVDPAPVENQSSAETERNPPAVVDPLGELLIAVLRFAGFAAAAAAIVAAPFLLVVAAKARRRRRRRTSSTNLARITGGWREFEDSLVDHGFRPSGSATRTEVAALIGGTRSMVLAAVADRAVFAPADTDGVEADRFWHGVDNLMSSLDSGVGRWHRLRAAVSTRSLLGRLGRGRSTTGGSFR